MAPKKTLFRETTEVPVTRSMAGIMDLLVQAGARSLTQHYDGEGKITGVQFSLVLEGEPKLFSLPARTEPVYKLLMARKAGPSGYRRRGRPRIDAAQVLAQAERVAWRQLFAWVEAQIAMIQTGMVEAVEVFLPYAWDARTGQTFFQAVRAEGLRMLPAPQEAK